MFNKNVKLVLETTTNGDLLSKDDVLPLERM